MRIRCKRGGAAHAHTSEIRRRTLGPNSTIASDHAGRLILLRIPRTLTGRFRARKLTTLRTRCIRYGLCHARIWSPHRTRGTCLSADRARKSRAGRHSPSKRRDVCREHKTCRDNKSGNDRSPCRADILDAL